MNNILKWGALIAMTSVAGTALAETAFDTALWTSVAHDADASDPRYDMIADAIAAVPAGTPREKVRAVLGEADADHGSEWVYYAGTTLFGGEYILLVVSFDGDAVSDVKQISRSETYVPPQSRDQMKPAG